MALLELADVRAGYGQLEVLHGVDLHVEQNEIVCLIGANGAGKSTLLRAVSRLTDWAQGTFRLDGRELGTVAAHVIPALGIAHVPEGRRVFPDLSVAENLRMGHLAAAGRVNREAQYERVYSLFPVLRERRNQPAGTLSGGEQQMLAMGRAMMSAPRLLLLDEPSLGLSPVIVDRLFALIEEVSGSGVAVLLVEQNAYLALEVSSRGYVMESGAIRLTGTAAELAADPTVRNLYLGG